MGRKTYETKWTPHLDRIEQMALEGLSYAEIGKIFKVEGYVIRSLLYRRGQYITRKDVAKSSPEIKRLRAALHQIYGWYPISISNPRSTIEEMRKFAFETLKGKE
jgi:hypothetical protein